MNFDVKSGRRTPCSASVSNSVQIYAKMADLWPKVWFSIWRPPPSWILRDINFAFKISYGTPLSVSVSNVLWIRSKMAELWPYNWFQNGGRRRVPFLGYVKFDGKSGCRTPFTAYVSNLVQYIQKTYGQKCDFQYIGRHHLGFCGISILPVKPAMEPHFVSLCQIRCESVQKWPRYSRLTEFKMAAAAILNLLPMTIFVISSSLGSDWGCFCKIS